MKFRPAAVSSNVGARQAGDNALSRYNTGTNIFTMNERSQALFAIEVMHCFRNWKAMSTGDSHKVANA
jgi:hypothetical protein